MTPLRVPWAHERRRVPVRTRRALALGAGCSVLAETARYVLRLGRGASVDDVLLNASGAAPPAISRTPLDVTGGGLIATVRLPGAR
ncbi:VanZ family protein [Streptomyces sp. CC208A]|uniref:VanZ family protein n=1 Tax=Streptomyces sp. CC208A TaxID=3044573 RepID=UPI0032C19092